MSVLKTYNDWVLVDSNGQRGTDNFYAQYPYMSTYAAKHIFRVYYCGHPDCLRRIYKTWDSCHYCGQKINWENTDNKAKGGKYYFDRHGIKKLRKEYWRTDNG